MFKVTCNVRVIRGRGGAGGGGKGENGGNRIWICVYA
jgi:hypothetical protein